MQVAVLGPLQVGDSTGAAVPVSGARLQSLVARLALDAGRAVPAAVLIDAVWGDAPPTDAPNALQTLVSRLRRAAGASAAVVQDGSGYRLDVARDDVDAHRFERLARAGASALREGRPEPAGTVLREALALWRSSEPTVDEASAAKLLELRAEAVRNRIEADLALGRASAVAAELEAQASDSPLDERVAALLMRALAGSGRQADALAVFDRIRSRLADELGVDPSAALQEVHLAVLRGAAEPQRRRTNLRSALTSFVGRDKELKRVTDAVYDNRLVTLVGPGGAGKTRLAAESAAGLVDRFPDGVWFAELAPVTDPADVPQAVAGALGRREAHLLDRRAQQDPRDSLGQLLGRLEGQDLLLVLDNCEHLVEACAQLCDVLLGAAPRLRVLATSREPLAITGEALLPVVPLGPDAAVRLFAERARAVLPGFTLDEDTEDGVTEIVRRLDGLPLAIELAAARLRTLPLPEITARLSDRFRLLTGGSRTALPRHRTLRAVVEWSWDLLSEPERTLAERLAVFPAGVTAGTARAICADGLLPDEDIPDLLASLVDKSLLARVAGDRRMRMLETIREFGIDRLANAGSLDAALDRHAAYFARVVADAQGPLRTADQLPWLRILEAERENMLASLRHLAGGEQWTPAVEMAVGLGWYWMVTGADSEVATWLSYALDGASGLPVDLDLLARSMLSLARTMSAVGAPEDGPAAEEPLDLTTLHARLGTVDPARYPLLGLMRAVVAMLAGDGAGMRRAVSDATEVGDPWVTATAEMFLANVAENDGDVDLLRSVISSAYPRFQELGERWGMASCLQIIAQVQVLDGDLDAAASTVREALQLVDELGSHEDSMWLYLRLADIEARRGDLTGARRLLADRLEGQGPSPRETIFARLVLSDLEFRVGDRARAAQLHDEVMARLDALPPLHPMRDHGMAIARVIEVRQRVSTGDLEGAATSLKEALPPALASQDMPIVASVGLAAALLTAELRHPDEAALLLGVSARLRGSPDLTQVDIAELTARLRGELGDAVFEEAFERGRAMDRAAALETLRLATALSADVS